MRLPGYLSDRMGTTIVNRLSVYAVELPFSLAEQAHMSPS